MPRRRRLKDLAAGISTKFISRNNDLYGYWALGILYKDLSHLSLNGLSLNLLTGKSSPELKNGNEVAEKFKEYFSSQIKIRRFEQDQVKQAILTLQFEAHPSKEHLSSIGISKRGKPFNCSVLILDDLGNNYFFVSKGWCAKHDPGLENRSARIFD
ncbi:MAG: hypothetical protein ACMZ7B_05360 [Balneola sp.]